MHEEDFLDEVNFMSDDLGGDDDDTDEEDDAPEKEEGDAEFSEDSS